MPAGQAISAETSSVEGYAAAQAKAFVRDMDAVESVRKRYRPQQIMTLFVGESAPHGGQFFYFGNTGLTRYMKQAMEAAGLGGEDNFLERFKAYGWYLDDLVLTL
jgi:ferredoxin-NADP reductase